VNRSAELRVLPPEVRRGAVGPDVHVLELAPFDVSVEDPRLFGELAFEPFAAVELELQAPRRIAANLLHKVSRLSGAR